MRTTATSTTPTRSCSSRWWRTARRRTASSARSPGDLVSSEAMSLQQSSTMKTRKIRVERTNGLWTFNGQTWDDVIASGFKSVLANPQLGDTEVWDIENSSGGWFHPVHIHLVDFQILSRNSNAPF